MAIDYDALRSLITDLIVDAGVAATVQKRTAGATDPETLQRTVTTVSRDVHVAQVTLALRKLLPEDARSTGRRRLAITSELADGELLENGDTMTLADGTLLRLAGVQVVMPDLETPLVYLADMAA